MAPTLLSLQRGDVAEQEHDNQAEFSRLEEEDKRIAVLYGTALAAATGAIMLAAPIVTLGTCFTY